jgi:hypothetical protein
MLAVYLIETETLFKSGDFIPNSIRSYGKCVECADLKFTTINNGMLSIEYVATCGDKGRILYDGSYIIESLD